MCTKYTTLHYSKSLITCISYAGSVNCIKLPMDTVPVTQVSLASCIHTKRYEISKFKKVVKFYVHISPIFSWRVTKYVDLFQLHKLSTAIVWMGPSPISPLCGYTIVLHDVDIIINLCTCFYIAVYGIHRYNCSVFD